MRSGVPTAASSPAPARIHASGAYGRLSNAFWPRGTCRRPVRVENAACEFLQGRTNTVPGGYYRSPGSVAMFFALESHTDIIAKELRMDPAEYRLNNLIRDGEVDAVGQRVRSVRFREVLQAALDSADWKKPEPNSHFGRGIALFGRHISGGDTGIILTSSPTLRSRW